MEKPGGALKWSQKHNAEFELDKTALVCLSRKHIPDTNNPRKTVPVPRPPITISGHTIHPSSSHKFLGEQAASALAKGTKYTLACSRMTRMTKGIKGRWMRRLYEGVILPKMLYAADIWCAGLISKGRGKKSGGRGTRSFTSQMARVQRMVALLITGAMHSTPNDLLLAHANLPPFQQTLRMICHRSTLRMATFHDSHPLQKGIKSAFNFHVNRNFEGSKRHPSPLHKLFNEFKINPTTTETLEPVRHYPKWVPDVELRIASKPEEAYLEDTLADEDLRVYSDGSAIDGGIGGVAVLMEGDRMVDERRFYLGKIEEHTVYEGEIVGMILAVELLKERLR
ncbi:hypothetical protein BDR06DRAFT_983476 [Suillus hirtellus]|nr:hypothetical protein BDR06DRAFT_983476 [Suillus hirtellus]